MGLRETLNEKRGAVTTGAVLLTLIALVWVFVQMFGEDRADIPRSDEFYFTTDNGATWFADAKTKIPPFDVDGKTAYRLYVFTCDGSTEFAAYMLKFPEAIKPQLAELYKDPEANEMTISDMEGSNGLVKPVKVPDTDRAWVPMGDPRADAYLDPPCPNGAPTVDRSPVLP